MQVSVGVAAVHKLKLTSMSAVCRHLKPKIVSCHFFPGAGAREAVSSSQLDNKDDADEVRPSYVSLADQIGLRSTLLEIYLYALCCLTIAFSMFAIALAGRARRGGA